MGPKCRKIWEYYPTFSTDGARWGYIAEKEGLANDPKEIVVVDGDVLAEYDAASNLVFSANGKHVAYEAWNEKERKGFVVLDGKPGPTWDEVGLYGPSFSPDGNSVAYSARRGNVWSMVVNGQPEGEYDEITVPFVSVAFGKVQADTFHANGQADVFDAQGTHWAYRARKGTKWYVVVNGRPSSAYERVDEFDPLWYASGKRLVYWAKTGGKMVVVVDGQPGPPFDDLYHHIVCSADGKHVAYIGKIGHKTRVFLDGTAGPEFDNADGLVFSPDGKHLGYIAGMRGESSRVVVDGEAGPKYDTVFDEPGLMFHSDGTAEYLAKRGPSLFRVKQAPPAK